MRPWGNKHTDHPTEKLNKKLGDGMRDVVYQYSKTKYTSQKSVGLYPAYGALDDWY